MLILRAAYPDRLIGLLEFVSSRSVNAAMLDAPRLELQF